jgi:hypothetical protein
MSTTGLERDFMAPFSVDVFRTPAHQPKKTTAGGI